ncbi:HNH endonuclease [Mycobacterium sp. M1]|uniref:HNH endonuclease n=1 Tax=Mycolicibacter acidiphilus TaxID=2835306 RepID=A0ABS5RD41_9MYCO|nr:HNH endonuclease signature motif containing protein [Mycolicibacter acidiphilus]MBS9532079.1 HNH endonuclease [Mycolicibacter acidiphilus]
MSTAAQLVDAVVLDQPPRSMPPWRAVVAFWMENEGKWLKSWYIGWGEPFCFRCGWLAPVSDHGIPHDDPTTYVYAMWDRASCWLDRAHLRDRVYGGPDTADNMVALCHLCHDQMTRGWDAPTRDKGLEFVQAGEPCDMLWQVYTDDRLMGKRASRSTLFKARTQFVELMLRAHTAGPTEGGAA